LERKFGRFAITGLTRYIVALNGLTFLLLRAQPRYFDALTLDTSRIASGEVWRLVSYLFLPPTDSIIFILFSLYAIWMIGENLENTWGAFRLNLFYLLGMVGTTIACLLTGGGQTTNVFLNMSLFFAFATIFPNIEFLVFFILPVKVKWLALIAAAWLLTFLISSPWPVKASLIVAFANYFLFFGPSFISGVRTTAEYKRRREKFRVASVPDETLHRCSKCGATEVSNPERGFRVRNDDTEICDVCLSKEHVSTN
jgi:membrane associated rhomboid family serine protease